MITIDSKEAIAHPTIHRDLIGLGNKITVVPVMGFGDYSFIVDAHDVDGEPAHVGIELCTVPDVVGKIDSGRLAYQLSGMLEAYNVAILLIEQHPKVDTDGKILIPGSPYKPDYARYSAVTNAAQAYGVNIVYAYGRDSIAKTINGLYRYWNRETDTHKLFRPQQVAPQLKLSMGAPLDRRIQNLMTLPGVGETTANKLMVKFKSLDVIYSLPAESFAKVDGIGIETGRKIVDFIETQIEQVAVETIDELAAQLTGALQ